jgi:pimeloyl-ACP methyl ester carboxylesterase
MVRLFVHEWGSGPPVVLVHGAVLGGREAWRAQRPLTGRWRLRAPDRPGHGQSPPARQDFETEATLIADQLLGDQVHLVGLSYGGIVAMLAAVQRPARVRSLTVIEPPATGVARGIPVVDAHGADVRSILASNDEPTAMLRRFFQVNGVPYEVSDPLPEPLAKGVRQLRNARPPDEAELPLRELRDAPFPMLVVSGGHLEPYEIICDTIAGAAGGERAVCPGKGHVVPDTGAPFNALLEDFLHRASSR